MVLQEDCGFPVQVTGSASGVFIAREGKNNDDGVFPFMNQFTFSETWTNPATGEWFVIRGHALFNEVKATHVEGSIFEFRFVEAGRRSSSRTPTATSWSATAAPSTARSCSTLEATTSREAST